MALVILVAAPGVLYLFPTLAGADHAFVVLSGSMAPELDPGDVVFVDAVDPLGLQVGDVVTYRAPHEPDVLVTHRVIEILTDGDRVRYRTQGDANEDPDPFVVHPEMVVGTHAWTLPSWGLLLLLPRTRIGYVLLVLLPGGLVLAREGVRLYRALDTRERERAAQNEKTSDSR